MFAREGDVGGLLLGVMDGRGGVQGTITLDGMLYKSFQGARRMVPAALRMLG